MSRRLGLLNFGLRHIARPFLARTKTPEQAERDLQRASMLFRVPPNLTFESNAIETPSGPLPMARITAGRFENRGCILFFHGGGYVAGSADTHRGMLGRLSKLAGVPVFAPDYRLAHVAPFPAAFEDALVAWNALRAQGFGASQIVLAGDSAGGGLALAVMAHVLETGERPAGLIGFSPWTDLTLTGESLTENEATDAILPRARMEELCEIVLAGADPVDPRVSPLFATWHDPPPVYFQVSDTEILRDDGSRMAERLKEAGGEATVDVWPDAPHVWQLFDGWIPEAREALEKAADFAKARLNPRFRAES